MKPLIYSQLASGVPDCTNEVVLERSGAATSILPEWSGALVGAAQCFDASPEFTRRIYAAVSEAIINVFNHAYTADHAPVLRASVRKSATGLLLEIGDKGCGFEDSAWLNFQSLASGWAEGSRPAAPLCMGHRGKGLVDMIRVLDDRAGTFTIISGSRSVVLSKCKARSAAFDETRTHRVGTLVRWHVITPEVSQCR